MHTFFNFEIWKVLSVHVPQILTQMCTRFLNPGFQRNYPLFRPRLLLTCEPLFFYSGDGLSRFLSLESCSNMWHNVLPRNSRSFYTLHRVFRPRAQMSTRFSTNPGFQWFYHLFPPRLLLESVPRFFFKSGISRIVPVFFPHLFKGAPLVYISGFQRFLSVFSPNVVAL